MSDGQEPIEFLPDFGGHRFAGPDQLGHWAPEDVFSPWAARDGQSGVVGTPDLDAADWVFQSTPFTCAVVSQQIILKHFGVEVSEAQLVYDATSHGWLNAGGMSPNDVGRLLESYGVHCHARQGADVESLLAELAQGHKVIAGVDSGELTKQDWFFEDWFTPNRADHAVVVTGLDMRDPHHPIVILNDPGHPNGAGVTYPLEEFLAAWADSGQMFVATDSAPGDLVSHSIFGSNYNPDTGLYMDIAFWTAFLGRGCRDSRGPVPDGKRFLRWLGRKLAACGSLLQRRMGRWDLRHLPRLACPSSAPSGGRQR